MIIRKTIAFNTVDPDQKEMLDHAGKRPNFSGYVKRLIQRDMEKGFVFPEHVKPEKLKEKKDVEEEETLTLMGGLI